MGSQPLHPLPRRPPRLLRPLARPYIVIRRPESTDVFARPRAGQDIAVARMWQTSVIGETSKGEGYREKRYVSV